MTTKKTKIHKLCTTQLFYKNIRNFYPSHRNLSHHIVALGIIALSLIRSSVHHHQSMPRRLHRVEFSWLETKTYPIATHLDARSTWNLSRRTKATRPRAEHHSKFKSRDGGYLDRLGGENPRRNENIALEPRSFVFFCCCRLFGSQLFREGKVTCVPVVLETERCSVTQTRTQQAITSISMTSHWPTPLRFM